MRKLISDLVDEGRKLSFHLYEEAEKAIASWAVVEADRLSHEPCRRTWQRVQPRNFSLGAAHAQIVQACERDALMTLGRMTDYPKNDQYSLFGISKLLSHPGVLNALRLEALEQTEQFDRATLWLKQRVGEFDRTLKAYNWREADEKKFAESPYTLMKSRAELDRFRNAMIAHAGDRNHLGGRHLDRMRILVILTTYATKLSLLVFRGIDWDVRGSYRQHYRGQIALQRSISIDFIDHSTGPLARKMWERNAKL